MQTWRLYRSNATIVALVWNIPSTKSNLFVRTRISACPFGIPIAVLPKLTGVVVARWESTHCAAHRPTTVMAIMHFLFFHSHSLKVIIAIFQMAFLGFIWGTTAIYDEAVAFVTNTPLIGCGRVSEKASRSLVECCEEQESLARRAVCIFSPQLWGGSGVVQSSSWFLFEWTSLVLFHMPSWTQYLNGVPSDILN